MAEIIKQMAKISGAVSLTDDIMEMWIESPAIAQNARAGQFVSLYCRDGSRLLPRPISLCGIDRENGRIRLLYRVVGKGTREFASLKAGDTIDVMGPLGNGFTPGKESALLIGGGIGIPPMLALAEELSCEKRIVLGYRDGRTFLKEEFERLGKVYVATDDGSAGTKGNVIDAIEENALEAGRIYACGPAPMLRGVKEYAKKHGIPAQLSLEERMACGIGACLSCVCQSKEKDAHSNVSNKRVCKDGPVFDAEEIEL